MVFTTDNGRVMDISQILYDQYHIWNTLFGIYVLGAENQSFFVGKTTKSMFQNSADS